MYNAVYVYVKCDAALQQELRGCTVKTIQKQLVQMSLKDLSTTVPLETICAFMIELVHGKTPSLPMLVAANSLRWDKNRGCDTDESNGKPRRIRCGNTSAWVQ